ncbi:MAG: hypothetical protein M5U32_03125 [Myxococcota bacterium]|nr:hypothetical protein [Myxococcota bacterium]
MSAVASLLEALRAVDEGLLGALRTGDVEAAQVWAGQRESLIQRFARLVSEQPADFRRAIAAADAATIELCCLAERERAHVARELEAIRVTRSRLTRAGCRRPDAPRFVSRRT